MAFEETEEGVKLDRATGGRVVFTVGYEGRTLDEFLTMVRENHIQRIVDVRELPLSRKKGFSRGQLQRALEDRGVAYLPMRELGSPRHVRQEYKSGGDFGEFSRKYRTHLDSQRPSLVALRALSSEMSSAILCYERDWKTCHRSMLASFLQDEGFRLEHL